jgi:hypothetical protein
MVYEQEPCRISDVYGTDDRTLLLHGKAPYLYKMVCVFHGYRIGRETFIDFDSHLVLNRTSYALQGDLYITRL